MTAMDPLVPALTGLLVDVVWWLDSCGDEEVDPDSAARNLPAGSSPVGVVVGLTSCDTKDARGEHADGAAGWES